MQSFIKRPRKGNVIGCVEAMSCYGLFLLRSVFWKVFLLLSSKIHSDDYFVNYLWTIICYVKNIVEDIVYQMI